MGEHFHLHPLVVHFPIALFITALVTEILSILLKKETFHKIAYYNYFLGILGAIAAVIAAWWDGETLKHPVFYTHKNLAYWTTGVALTSGIVLPLVKIKSKKIFRIIFFTSLILTVSLVSITGYYGGKLVYEYGIGVEK